MRHIESRLQQSMIKWFRYTYPNHVLFAIPNGGKRNQTEAAIMKAEGVLAGVADLFLMCPNFHNGLFIEVKTPTGKQTQFQKDFEKKASDFGYKYVVVRSLEEFIKVVTDYLK